MLPSRTRAVVARPWPPWLSALRPRRRADRRPVGRPVPGSGPAVRPRGGRACRRRMRCRRCPARSGPSEIGSGAAESIPRRRRATGPAARSLAPHHSSRVVSSSGTVPGTTDRTNIAVVASSSTAAEPSTNPVVRRAAGERPDDPHGAQQRRARRRHRGADRSAAAQRLDDRRCGSELQQVVRAGPAAAGDRIEDERRGQPEHAEQDDVSGADRDPVDARRAELPGGIGEARHGRRPPGRRPTRRAPMVNSTAEPTSGVSHCVTNHRHPAAASSSPKAVPARRSAAAAPTPTARQAGAEQRRRRSRGRRRRPAGR